jgi:hypothetical protein
MQTQRRFFVVVNFGLELVPLKQEASGKATFG